MVNEAVVTTKTKKGKWRRRAKRVVVAMVLFYCVVLWWVGCGHMVDTLVMFPQTGELDSHGAKREMVKVPGGAEVELWTARSPGAANRDPTAYVIYFVGNADRADRWATFNARQWGDMPIETVGMNYPGFGGSQGEAYLKNVGPAALATYDWVKAKAGKLPIFVQGTSLGTTAALCVAARREVAGLTLKSPPPLRQLILQQNGWWNLWLLAAPGSLMVPSDLDSVANARMVKAPAVFVLTEQDEIVPVRFQRMVMEAYRGEAHLIDLPGATHNSDMSQAEWDEFGKQAEWLYRKAGLGEK